MSEVACLDGHSREGCYPLRIVHTARIFRLRLLFEASFYLSILSVAALSLMA